MDEPVVPWITRFLPEEWSDFAELLDAIVPPGPQLYRWEEWSFEDGTRRRAAHLVRSVDAPPIEALRAAVLDGARQRGFRLTRIEGEPPTTRLAADDRELKIELLPLPPQIVLVLDDRMARRGAQQYPAIAPVFRLAAAAGAARFTRLHRFAELDLEVPDRFHPAWTEMVAAGPYDASALCSALASAGFVEDGDAWIRESRDASASPMREEVKLRDAEVRVLVAAP